MQSSEKFEATAADGGQDPDDGGQAVGDAEGEDAADAAAAADAQVPSAVDGGNPPLVEVPPIYPKDGFCNEAGASWAWCEDFDGQGMNAPVPFDAKSSGAAFQSHGYMTLTGTTCESTKKESKQCVPYVRGGALFMNAEDSGFGMNVIRIEQPFDFAGREGHIHYRSDMKAHGRMHQTVHIAPMLSNSLPDLRFVTVLEAVNLAPALDIEFNGDGLQPLQIVTWKDGQRENVFYGPGPLGTVSGEQHDLDFYVSRTRVRVLLDGKQVHQQDVGDIGFDRGYVHFAQLSYNPTKDGFVGDAANRFLWDNLAFDGPSLAKNLYTPTDKQDVLFRAYGKGSCTVRGIAADGPVIATKYFMYDTWHVQLGINEPPVTLADISCVANQGGSPPYGDPVLGDIQIIKR